MATVPFAWPALSLLEQALIVGWCLSVVLPIGYAIRSRAPLSLGIVLAVLFGSVMQALIGAAYRMDLIQDFMLWFDLVLIPGRMNDPRWWHTAVTAGFLHAQFDLMHVLGNVVILASGRGAP